MRFRNIAGCVVVAAVASGAVAPAVAAPEREGCPGGHAFVATIVTLGGAVDARSAAGGTVPIAVGTPLCPGDGIATCADRRVELRFAALDTTVGLSRSSSLKLPAADDSEANVEMLSGVMRFLSSVRQFFSVRTQHANAGIDGTEAVIAVDGPLADSLFVVQEGDVTLTARLDEQESVSLEAGQAGFVSQNFALTLASAANVPAKFRNLVADPAGAADWAIHFPPVLGSGAPAAARQAAARLAAGDPDGAEELLAGHEDAASLSLRAVVAVLRNRTDEGADLATRAVAADPALAAAHVAQSYALQAQGQVAAARQFAERAVEADPADTNARARLAELLLTEGDRTSAVNALAAIPEDGHTALSRGVEGLALLAANRRRSAIAAFEQGIARDSEAPLPRLGLGLAKIRAGDVASGRRELELAAALDPRRASLRTWLGRAYAAEGQARKAASQFEEAKARDPDDPTNPAAHSLLSDALGDHPGREIARTSAILQAQVYDPPGKTMIRPQRSESDLALLETQGAARATFAEFAPFFDSDGIRAYGSGFGGTQHTLGDEVSVSALYGGFSLGVGQFHYETDGYRSNDTVEHDVVSVQAKAQLLPWLDLFGE